MSVTRLNVSLEQYEIGMSGAIPNRTDWSEPAMDRGILEFVALFTGIVLKYGGRIIHGCHPTFTPVILRQARLQAPRRLRRPVTLVMSDLWAQNLSREDVDSMTDIAEFIVTRKIGDKGPEDPETRNRSLTAMRSVLISTQNVTVAVGGMMHNGDGIVPGVAEEIAIARQRGLPCFLVGGLGGLTQKLTESLAPSTLRNSLTDEVNLTLFRTDNVAGCVNVVGQFDYRYKTYVSGHGNSSVWHSCDFENARKAIVPQWRVLRESLPMRVANRVNRYRIGFRDVAQPRDERSLIATLIPPGTVCGHKVPTIDFELSFEWAYLPWLVVANSLVMDWVARSRLSSAQMSFTVLDSLPFPRKPVDDAWLTTVAPIALRLLCVGPEMSGYWNAMARLGFVQSISEGTVPDSAIVRHDERAQARAQLDARVAKDVFGLGRQEFETILDAFPALQRKEKKEFGEFRTRRLVLGAYDSLP